MISESTPSTFSCVGDTACGPKKHSRMAYKGLVPMSPYTTPTAVRVTGSSALGPGTPAGTVGLQSPAGLAVGLEVGSPLPGNPGCAPAGSACAACSGSPAAPPGALGVPL